MNLCTEFLPIFLTASLLVNYVYIEIDYFLSKNWMHFWQERMSVKFWPQIQTRQNSRCSPGIGKGWRFARRDASASRSPRTESSSIRRRCHSAPLIQNFQRRATSRPGLSGNLVRSRAGAVRRNQFRSLKVKWHGRPLPSPLLPYREGGSQWKRIFYFYFQFISTVFICIAPNCDPSPLLFPVLGRVCNVRAFASPTNAGFPAFKSLFDYFTCISNKATIDTRLIF